MIVTILRPLLVVGYGSNMAAVFAALMLLAQGRKDVLFEAGLVGTMAGMMLSVIALWGIRYPQQAQAETAPIEDTQPVLPRRFMQIVDLPLHRRVEWPLIDLRKMSDTIRVLRVQKYFSVRVMRKAGLSDREIGNVRAWVLGQGLGEADGRGGIPITPEGVDKLERLSPIAAEIDRK